jgi:hypothetical protein
LGLQDGQLKEECPSCGALLIDTLQNRRISSAAAQQNQVVTSTNQKPAERLSVDFQTAYQQIEDSIIKFSFDIPKIDSLLDLNARGSLCIIGEQKYTQLMINRLCVHSMLPRRHGGVGLDHLKIIAIDAGNCTDVYQFVDFARQYGMEVKGVLQNIVVSRVFTIYQLAHIISYELPRIIERLSSDRKNNLIVVYGLLHLFVSDPHIDKGDAHHLIEEIARSFRRLSKDRFVVVSFARCNSEYEKSLLPIFDKRIEITEDVDNSELLQMNLFYRPFKSKVLTDNVPLSKETVTLAPSK